MQTRNHILSLSILPFVALGCRTAEGETPAEMRAATQQMATDALAELYAVQPSARGQLESAYGYAVFSNLGTNLFLFATGQGFGIAHANSGSDTYMRMAEVGVGIGLGIKDFRAVFIFENEVVFEQFIDEGWSFGGEADAAATHDDAGGAMSSAVEVAPGISVYQLTETGLALQATVGGTRYWKDDDLNAR
jgi:lipid-binding SYLF domain-containing protein